MLRPQQIEVRPGWSVSEVTVDAQNFVVNWHANPGTPLAKSEHDEPLNLVIAVYDAAAHRRISELHRQSVAGALGEEMDLAYARRFLGACHDPIKPMTSGYDWRVSHFDSFRAYACGPLPAEAKTVFWSHLDVAPSLKPTVMAHHRYARRTWALNGDIAVAQDGTKMHLFDIAARRDIAQIETSVTSDVQAVQLLSGKKLVLIESRDLDETTQQSRQMLRAYSF